MSPSYFFTGISYYVVIMYFLAAIESEFLGNLPYEVELLSRKEYRSNFCYSVEECCAAYPQAMDITNRFYKVKECNDIFMNGMNEKTEWSSSVGIYDLKID